jgi:hypothetical protein
MATMNMADWGRKGEWYSAKMRLEKALGFGAYEQSIKVGKGSGVITTFYLSEKDKDTLQEIDFEFVGHRYLPVKPGQPCGTESVWTNVWLNGQQFGETTPLWAGDRPPPGRMPDSTQDWGFSVYRYKIDWERNTVSWSVDRTGIGNSYEVIRKEDISKFGYKEELCYPFISFWHDPNGWSPDGSPFLKGEDATGDCGASGKCYQAFYFQSLKFTPSSSNQITRLGS